ncbi:type VI secretion system-associated protein TagF [Pseudophaeobacter sp. MA21411-1]|nr:type VI secretion system-associated protein TagF [Pseudophaeobacter flagellatus]
MPAVGDFFRSNVPPGFVRVWDAWLQQVLLTAQTQYGDQFDPHYMSAPLWRFTLAAGAAGPSKVMGVLMPSVDRVGRRFPLTLVVPLDGSAAPAQDHFQASTLFEQMENIALSTLEKDISKSGLETDLAALSLADMLRPAPMQQAGKTLVFRGTDDSCGRDPQLDAQLAGVLLAEKSPAGCLWSTHLASGPRLLVTEDLPLGQAALGLFDLGAPIWQEASPL